jgi:DNA-3-methyladenine glycosylase
MSGASRSVIAASKRRAIKLDLRTSGYRKASLIGAEEVARDLIGCYFLRRRGGRFWKARIIETEAYVGPQDLACHASRGRTMRTEVMFRPAGTLYVYLIHGLHWMLNVVTGPVDFPAAVLIRSVDGICGPGRLSRTLGITGALNGWVASEPSGLWFARDEQIAALKVVRTPRIGVEYAGPIWSAKRYRFVAVIAQ